MRSSLTQNNDAKDYQLYRPNAHVINNSVPMKITMMTKVYHNNNDTLLQHYNIKLQVTIYLKNDQ